MKKSLGFIIILFILCIGVFLSPVQAEAPEELTQDELEEQWRLEMEQGIETQLDDLDLSGLEQALLESDDSAKEAIGSYSVRQMIEEIISGDMPFSIGNAFSMVWKVFLREALANWPLILKIIVLALLSSLLISLRSSFSKEGVGEVAYFVCYLLIMVVIVQTLVSTLSIGTKAINTMVSVMQGAFPMLLALLTSLGGSASAGVFQPAMAMLSGGIATLMRDIVLPLVLVCGVFVIISNVSEKMQIKRLAGLTKSGCSWVIGIVFTLYVAISAIQGMTAASIDGISIRAAKYTIDKFLPIAGKMLSDTVDTVLSCSLIVKNATGVAAMIITIGAIAVPLIQILVNVFMFRIAAALLEPVADKRLVDCLSELSNIMVLLLVVVLAVGMMLLITFGLLMSAGNTNIMMR